MHTGSEKKKSETEVLHIPKKLSQSITADTSPIELYDESKITFTTHRATYLDSIISSNLSDDTYVSNRITKTFGLLQSLIFCNPYLPLKIKKILVYGDNRKLTTLE